MLQGSGGMDESYLTGEPFLIAKAPGTSVLSGAINGEAARTIQATRLASDSRYARIVEVLHASEEIVRKLPDSRLNWRLVHAACTSGCAGKLALQRRIRALFLPCLLSQRHVRC